MNTSTSELTDVEADLREALENLPRCESANHKLSVYGHEADKPGAFMIFPSCGHVWIACEPWTLRILKGGKFYSCPDDGEIHISYINAYTPVS